MTGENKILTIDCGKSGGVAIGSLLTNDVEIMKLTESFDELTNQFIFYAGAVAYVETQNLRKIDCMTGRWLNIHKLCLHYQRIKDACECCDIEVIEITPQKWQKPLNLKAKNYLERKKELKNHCIKIYPDLKITGWNQDALLMMSYLKQK